MRVCTPAPHSTDTNTTTELSIAGALCTVSTRSGREKLIRSVAPSTNEDAHRIAKRLGFMERKDDEYGTSIMLVGSHIDIDALRIAIEDYWWPRMWSNRLSGRIVGR